MRSPVRFGWFAVGAACLTLALGHVARAANADPAAAQVDVFDHALLDTMKDANALGPEGRYHKLAPVIERLFDLATMTRYSVGPAWTTMSPADQRGLIDAFSKLSIASYAHNFNGYSGEHFVLNPNVQTRGSDKLVQAQLVPTNGSPVSLAYRMRQSDGTWKIIDVYFDAISQLTTRRADFAAPLAAGGAQGLIKHLNATTDKLMK
jgi:phospholipid transport system substrate-binding protein